MNAFRLPVDESVVDILGIIHALEMEAGAEFSDYLDEAFKADGNPEWFEEIRHYRKSMNEPSRKVSNIKPTEKSSALAPRIIAPNCT